MAGLTIYTAMSVIMKGSAVLANLRSARRLQAFSSSSMSNESEKLGIREKAEQKISEMRTVVTDLTQHNEECIKRREQLQKTAETYLNALEASRKNIKQKMSPDDMRNAVAKIEKLKSLVNEFSYHNQEGIRRRLMMQDRAHEYLKALDDYRLKLKTIEQIKLPPGRDTRE